MEPTRLRNARTHTLKGIDLDLVAGQLVTIAGVSGAGKSSLAIDTLYAEGQRRFVESFSAYARQFLERRDRPPVGSLDPVPPAIAVDRGSPVRTSRSTVGTMTELTDHLRLLWARSSTITCDGCNREVTRGTVSAATDAVLAEDGLRAVVTWRVAVDDAERYLGVNPLVPLGWRFLAQSSAEQGDTPTAIGAWRTLIQLDAPDPAGAHYQLAQLLRKNGETAEARTQVILALEEVPRYREALSMLLDLNRSAPKVDGAAPDNDSLRRVKETGKP